VCILSSEAKECQQVPEVDICGLVEIGNSNERHIAHNLDRFGPLGA
jgi:hypothetical protein